MPLKQDRTSYNVSNNLKTAMNGAGYSTALHEGNTYYDGSGSEIHLALFMLPGGAFRTITIKSVGTTLAFTNNHGFGAVSVYPF